MKKDRNRKIILGACFIIFAVLAITQANTMIAGAINLAVLFVMFSFIYAGYGKVSFYTDKGITEVKLCKEDLLELSEKIKESQNLDFIEVMDELKENFEFKCSYMKRAFENFIHEWEASFTGNQSYYHCDISEYIHEDLIDDIGNSSFNEFVSNAMTGLGIFGTFVGLVVGLHAFDTTSAETLTNSISPLIEGIKVAFYTSIFGVVLSLVYGTFYRNYIVEAYSALHEFESAYYKFLGQHPDNTAISKLLQYQESQTDSMNQFAEDISIAIADVIEDKIMPSLTSIPYEIAGAINETMAPTIMQMNNQLESVATNLTDAQRALPSQIANAVNEVMNPTMLQLNSQFESVADRLANAQSEGVERIVNQFVAQMQEVMGGQFDSLKNSIQAICEWQEKTVAVLDETLASITKNTDDLVTVNTVLEQSIVKLEHYIEQLDEVQTRNDERTEEILVSFNTTSDNIVSMSERLADIFNSTNEIVQGVSENMNTLQGSSDAIMELVSVQTSHLRENSELISQYAETMSVTISKQAEEVGQAISVQAQAVSQAINEEAEHVTQAIVKQAEEVNRIINEDAKVMNQMCEEITDSFEVASAQMAQASNQLIHNMDTTMERSYAQFDSQLAKAMEHFSGTLLEMKESVENAPKVVDVATQKMQKATVIYLEQVKKAQDEYTSNISLLMKDITKNSEHIKDYTKQVDTTVKSIAKYIKSEK